MIIIKKHTGCLLYTSRGNKILLLDEITSNLDLSLEERLADHFQELVQNGYTIISISHRLSFLKYAQDVYEMREGKARLQRDKL